MRLVVLINHPERDQFIGLFSSEKVLYSLICIKSTIRAVDTKYTCKHLVPRQELGIVLNMPRAARHVPDGAHMEERQTG